MPSSTLNTMLPEFARRIGSFIGSFTTTTPIAASALVISTGLAGKGHVDDDALNEHFVRITAGANLDVMRFVSDYTAATSTITVSGPVLATDGATNVTFEVYRLDPSRLINHLNDAAHAAFPALHQEINDRTLNTGAGQGYYARPSTIPARWVRQIYLSDRLRAKSFANNLLQTLNCDFENGTDDWTGGSITFSAESAGSGQPDNYVVFASGKSGKLVVTASYTGTIFLTVPSGTAYVGQEVNFVIWVYSKTASRVAACVQESGTTVATGTAHSGGGWEQLSVSRVIAQGSTSVKVGITISAGASFTCWADEAIAVAGPSEPPHDTDFALMEWQEEGDYIHLLESVPPERALLIRGAAPLSTVTIGTDTMQINETHRKLLYMYAAAELYQGDIDITMDAEQEAALRRWKHYRNRAEEATGAMVALPMLRMAV